jgi:hypothetical protein
MPYHIGAKGSYGCAGYPAVKEGTNEVMGCHNTRAEAAAQIYAINRSEGNIDKSMHVVREGDFVMGMTKEGMIHGMVEHIMTEGGTLGTPGTEYALESMPPENPAMSVRIYKEEEDGWEPTAYSIGMMYKDAEVIDIDNHSMENEEADDEESEMESEENYMDKAKKPNYGEMIQPRSGGSEPANAQLYARIIREAKDKFDVYPSAVANSWVVQEYKRRGGTYKADKRERSMATRERMAEAGTAMPDGSYPIANGADLRNAIQSVGRAKDYEKAKAHIISRARSLGMMEMLPESWRGTARKGITGWGGSVFDLNPFKK